MQTVLFDAKAGQRILPYEGNLQSLLEAMGHPRGCPCMGPMREAGLTALQKGIEEPTLVSGLAFLYSRIKAQEARQEAGQYMAVPCEEIFSSHVSLNADPAMLHGLSELLTDIDRKANPRSKRDANWFETRLNQIIRSSA
jgi:hypothetical protein